MDQVTPASKGAAELLSPTTALAFPSSAAGQRFRRVALFSPGCEATASGAAAGLPAQLDGVAAALSARVTRARAARSAKETGVVW